jgi:pyruvate dehydrogenase E1 component
VPIVADEARTFGMANLFKQVGIYSSVGQSYEPEDIGSVLSYREALDGQILEEGISEAGAIASWTAAATSYSVHGWPMLPFYIYYSMFGFQRVGDAIWAAADQRSRGFPAGRDLGPHRRWAAKACSTRTAPATWWPRPSPTARPTTLPFAGENGRDHRPRHARDAGRQQDVFYYVTLMNENYAQPDLPAGAEEA